MKNISKTMLVALATGLISCALFTSRTQAVPINGSIDFRGGVELDTGTVNTATQVMTWLDQSNNLPTVNSRDGDFATFVNDGDTTTFANMWHFNSGPRPTFWTVDGFTFDLTDSHITTQGGGFLDVFGEGFVSGHGFTSTYMEWRFTTQDPPSGQPPVFSFSASTNSVPDSGATVALLGIALAGVEGVRRMFRARKS
jgi:hypothetical protein